MQNEKRIAEAIACLREVIADNTSSNRLEHHLMDIELGLLGTVNGQPPVIKGDDTFEEKWKDLCQKTIEILKVKPRVRHFEPDVDNFFEEIIVGEFTWDQSLEAIEAIDSVTSEAVAQLGYDDVLLLWEKAKDYHYDHFNLPDFSDDDKDSLLDNLQLTTADGLRDYIFGDGSYSFGILDDYATDAVKKAADRINKMKREQIFGK